MIFSWSSGKDSTYALMQLLNQNIEISTLFTTISSEYKRVSMHGLHIDLLQAQADAIGIPLRILELPEQCSMEEYGKLMTQQMEIFKEEGENQVAFGDIFLEDLKQYREENCKKMGFEAVFPIFGSNTTELAQAIVQSNIQTKLVCINSDLVPKNLIGAEYNNDLLGQLPKEVDPCGENGEFHTFVWNAPIFKQEIQHSLGEIVEKQYPDPTGKSNQGPKFLFQEILNTTN